VAIAGLLLLTIQSARGGIWLLFVLALPAAQGLHRIQDRPLRLGVPMLLLAAAIAAGAFIRGPLPVGPSDQLIDRAIGDSEGAPILAEPVAAEHVAAAGGKVWLANPLDAFSSTDQRLYLDWLEGKVAGDLAVTRVPQLILVDKTSAAGRRARNRPDLRKLASDDRAVLYARR
jgi:hypothetical protein